MLESSTLVEVKYEDLYNLSLQNNKIILLSVQKDNIKYEFLMKLNNESDKLLVVGSGAYDYNKIKPPVFQRLSWINEFDTNVIYYNDPTLYLGKISLGWGYGTTQVHHLEVIKEILNIISNKISVLNNNIVFYGSSGGGFMSMMLATLIKDSVAIVNNPQTDIMKYYKESRNKLFDVVYSNNIEAKKNNDIHRISVIGMIKREKYIPKIIYLQNMACDFDMQNQFMPFIENIKKLDESYFYNNIEIKLYFNSKEGHTLISKKDTINIINAVLYNNVYSINVSENKQKLYCDKVNININDNNKIIVEIDNTAGEEFACYLLANNRIVKKISYQKKNIFHIEPEHKLEDCSVKVFIKKSKYDIERVVKKVL